jgi:fucose 4-O-acetylase-like acetyltransferase
MRNTDFDIARAISIMLVVFGHSLLVPVHPALNEALTSVRMPLFLMLSGVFFKPDAPLWETAHHKAKALLKPYLVVAVLLGSYSFLRGQVEDPWAHVMGVLSFNGPQIPGWLFPLWFLSFLWALHTVGNVLCRATGFSQRGMAWQLCFVLTLAVLGHAALPGNWAVQRCVGVGVGYVGLPFSADLLPLGLAWFLLGHLLGPALRSQAMPLNWTVVCSLVFAACQVLAAPSLDLFAREASDVLFSSLAGLSGTLAILGWSQATRRLKRLPTVLAPIGRNSLYLLMWHTPMQSLLGKQVRGWWPEHPEAASWLTLLMVIVACQGVGEFVRRHTMVQMWFEPVRHRAPPAGQPVEPAGRLA